MKEPQTNADGAALTLAHVKPGERQRSLVCESLWLRNNMEK